MLCNHILVFLNDGFNQFNFSGLQSIILYQLDRE